MTLPRTDVTEQSENEIIQEYEAALRTWFGARYCLALSSGTAALIAALHAVGVEEGDEVITSPAAPLCTVYPILSRKAHLRFSDIQENNFGLDLTTMEKWISPRTRAIIEVPMWGYPIPADAIRSWAHRRGLALIFDLAHCTGAGYRNRSLSSFCDIACFSTQKNKVFSTGEGGFLLTDNEYWYSRACLYSKMGELNGIDFGLNFKISHLQARAGIEGIEDLPNNLARRRYNSEAIAGAITHPNIEAFPLLSDGCPSYQRLIIRTKNGAPGLALYMEQHNIPSDIIKYRVRPLYDYPILSHMKCSCPNAERTLETMTTIPVHVNYTMDQLEHIVDVINHCPF